MKVLLSIKPQFVDEIFNGNKRYEYRKSIFRNPNVRSIIIYATMPVGKIVGEFDIEEILEEHPKTLWEKTKKYSGVSEEFYNHYFMAWVNRKKMYTSNCAWWHVLRGAVHANS